MKRLISLLVIVVVAILALIAYLLISRRHSAPTPAGTATMSTAAPTLTLTQAMPLSTQLAATPIGEMTSTHTPQAPTPTPVSTDTATPTAQPEPTATETPTAAPTTPEPVTAKVSGTEGDGLRLREGPGLNYDKIRTLPEGTLVQIIGGPVEADGHQWFNIIDDLGNEGWCAGDWLETSQ